MSHNEFGGHWTERKLQIVRSYMKAYTQALKNQNFRLIYIDAFAGTGKREAGDDQEYSDLLFDLRSDDKGLLDGSARIALQNQPPFDEYVFAEKIKRNAAQLQSLKREFSDTLIEIIQDDANAAIPKILKSYNWRRNRGLLFLDPYGAQLEWATLEKIARTESIDIWYLFPSGIAVNRMLSKTGDIPESWARRLDLLIGTEDWRTASYKTVAAKQTDLFEKETEETREKTANIQSIEAYFLHRLSTIFPFVGERAVPIRASNGSQMYSLCFAVSNPAPAATGLAKRLWAAVLKEADRHG